jgi:hypothetical protein
MTAPDKLLKLLLALCGLGCIAGLPALYIPRSWMVAGHEWLEMGPFPDPPIAEYLARLTSGLYAIYGALVLVMAADVRRYAPLITAQALLILGLALSGGYFGWPIGIPKWWIASDITAVIFYCGATLVLQRMIRRADRRREALGAAPPQEQASKSQERTA